ncbi:unnamed protein product [Vitrella brassicaformis CCMP3155]|uniref:WD repeat-containing protein 54 beta-propeller domain-containing protein n=1 Tax=Vitrella brassicaformis (strain CCMP3155) TaxID=1169540 RepID=A0A0G4F6I2_VITBC|nr:unnamed protein product [Vitrella brassicaformis CCMP3155]|mmetsp:Transcript_35206/g.101269  ORF Transcript_35206/g.101269 Transcript_35206/m.101269 type:complete len:350 (+) Transcript_35206:63-1112(+)|eukprot:CEM08024.1 unnamed protein product [Vitrella brassicaformis CCMP3155]
MEETSAALHLHTTPVVLKASPSLIHGNLVASQRRIAYAHQSKVCFYAVDSERCVDGPTTSKIISLHYVHIRKAGPKPMLIVNMANGTQMWNQDGTRMLYYLPVQHPQTSATSTSAAQNAAVDIGKCHRGAAVCAFPQADHVIIGSSAGELIIIRTDGDAFHSLATRKVASASPVMVVACSGEGSDQHVMSGHANGEIVWWRPEANGMYMQLPGALQHAQDTPTCMKVLGNTLYCGFGTGHLRVYDAVRRELKIEIAAHGRWINDIDVRHDGLVASVGEDTVLNVWRCPSCDSEVSLAHSAVVTESLLTGVAFTQRRGDTADEGAFAVCVVAYDSEVLYFLSNRPWDVNI